MARLTIDISNNLNLAIEIISELQGISKSHFLRKAVLEYILGILVQGNLANLNKAYLISLLRLSCQEMSEKELSPQFKKVFLENLTKLETSLNS